MLNGARIFLIASLVTKYVKLIIRYVFRDGIIFQTILELRVKYFPCLIN
jgi:hypothetical protein